MSGPDDVDRPADRGRSTLSARLDDAFRSLPPGLRNAARPVFAKARRADSVAVTVAGIVVVGLLVRIVLLGARTAHFDEGRVGYWILHFVETGEFHYRYIIHGPFVQHVNAALFQFVAADDFTLRLVVALIGGLFPLSVLLLREHLSGPEVVAGAFFLAADPAMLYYSRFFRSTIPVAAFSFVAFALLVRFSDTRRFRYFHGAVLFVALAFTAKENAAIYLLVWVGAGALLLDHTLFRAGDETSGVEWLRGRWERDASGRRWDRILVRWAGHGLVAFVLFVAVIVFFYAPRAGSSGGVGLWTGLASGDVVPVLEETWRSIQRGYEYWFGGGLESGERYATIGDRFVAYFGRFADTLLSASGPLVALAVVGFVAERYATRRRRNLVMFASYWGFVSVLGYPLGTDIIGASWTTVNVVVPLAIPAAVGIAMIYRWGMEAREEGDGASGALVGVVLALVVFHVVTTGVTTSYVSPQSPENKLVQYAQPADDLHPTIRDIETLATANDGTDVLFYGDALATNDTGGQMEPGCAKISDTLPLQWYLNLASASADCATTSAGLDTRLSDDPPPVVIVATRQDGQVAERLPEYERRVLELRAPGGEVSYFLDTDRLADDGS